MTREHHDSRLHKILLASMILVLVFGKVTIEPAATSAFRTNLLAARVIRSIKGLGSDSIQDLEQEAARSISGLPGQNSYLLGQALYQVEALELAQMYFEHAATVMPERLLTLQRLGTIYEELGEHSLARQCFSRVGDCRSLTTHGLESVIARELDEGLSWLDEVIAGDCSPAFLASAYRWQGEALIERQQLEAASTSFEASIAASPTNENAEHSLLWLARIAADSSDYTMAYHYLDQARRGFPNSDRAWLEQGAVELKQGNLDDAVQAVVAALDLRQSSIAYHNLSLAEEARGRLCKAILYASQAVVLQPTDVIPRQHLEHLYSLDNRGCP